MNNPKNTKFKKYHKGKLKNIISKNPMLLKSHIFGNTLLVATENGRIYPNQLTVCKQTLNKTIKKHACVRFNIFTHLPITKKPLEIRMGKGKGAVNTWAANIFSGTKIVELESVNKNLTKKALTQIQKKLPFKTKIIYEQ